MVSQLYMESVVSINVTAQPMIVGNGIHSHSALSTDSKLYSLLGEHIQMMCDSNKKYSNVKLTSSNGNRNDTEFFIHQLQHDSALFSLLYFTLFF